MENLLAARVGKEGGSFRGWRRLFLHLLKSGRRFECFSRARGRIRWSLG